MLAINDRRTCTTLCTESVTNERMLAIIDRRTEKQMLAITDRRSKKRMLVAVLHIRPQLETLNLDPGMGEMREQRRD